MMHMTEMTVGSALFAIVAGAAMIGGAVLPMGFNHVNRHGTGEPVPPRTTFRQWRQEAGDHLRRLAPWNIVGDFFRGWEGIGTTFICLFGSACTFSWIATGAFLFGWGVLWLLS